MITAHTKEITQNKFTAHTGEITHNTKLPLPSQGIYNTKWSLHTQGRSFKTNVHWQRGDHSEYKLSTAYKREITRTTKLLLLTLGTPFTKEIYYRQYRKDHSQNRCINVRTKETNTITTASTGETIHNISIIACLSLSEFRSCVKVEVAVPGSPS